MKVKDMNAKIRYRMRSGDDLVSGVMPASVADEIARRGTPAIGTMEGFELVVEGYMFPLDAFELEDHEADAMGCGKQDAEEEPAPKKPRGRK